MSKGIKFTAAALCWALLVFLHLYRLSAVPGLHYDEAWAMNFSWRIASEPGFWPLTAMSPYTSPWTHYWAALWLKLFGPSLAVFRGSQVALSLGGLALLCGSLPRHLRFAFPFACLLLPGLLLNHRFAVELTGFHALCFGALALAIRRERWLLACIAALLGSTAHILFYAVPLALLGVACFERFELPRRARAAALGFFALSSLFFLRVLLLIPEKGKAAALLLSAVMALALLAARLERWSGWAHLRAPAFVAALAFGFNAVFFAQGQWGMATFLGFAVWDSAPLAALMGAGMLALVVLLTGAAAAAPRGARTMSWLVLPLLGGMMLKPAPRYFEIALLGFAFLLAWNPRAWPVLPFRIPFAFRLARYAALYSLVISFWWIGEPALSARETNLRALFFKDSSRDFLDKQALVRFLGGSGCGRDDIETHDPRLKEELQALSLGDWPVNRARPCAWSYVAPKSEPGAPEEAFGEFRLRSR